MMTADCKRLYRGLKKVSREHISKFQKDRETERQKYRNTKIQKESSARAYFKSPEKILIQT